eukprot:GHVU01217243.1.p1 GENE.GHVU01217243.1~~GHVU01217243.1.p1  ORF type:complete len:146 (+),score=23.49 GHVU01217243.1:64-501(+)
MGEGEQPKKRTFRTFSYKGVTLEGLLDMKPEQVMELYRARIRRKFSRGISKKTEKFMRKLREAKKKCDYGEKPEAVKTHTRNMVIMPEMIGSVVGVYNGMKFIHVEIKPEMIGKYLGEFSMTYTPCQHGKAGAAATKSSRFIPLK